MEGMDLPELLISTKVGSHPSRQFSYAAEDLRWSLDDSSRLLGRERLDLGADSRPAHDGAGNGPRRRL